MNKPRRYLITGKYCPSHLRNRNVSLNQRRDRSIPRYSVCIVRSRSNCSDTSEKSNSTQSNCLMNTVRKNQSNLTVGCKHEDRSPREQYNPPDAVRFSSAARLLNYKSTNLSDLPVLPDSPSVTPQSKSFGSLRRLPATSALIQVNHSTSKPDRCDQSSEKDDRSSEKCGQSSEKDYQSSEQDDQSNDGSCCPPSEYASLSDECSGPNNTYDKMRKKFKKHFTCFDNKLKSQMMEVQSKAATVIEDHHIDIDKTVHCVLSKYCPKDDCCHKVTASICKSPKPGTPVTCCPPKRLSRSSCSKKRRKR